MLMLKTRKGMNYSKIQHPLKWLNLDYEYFFQPKSSHNVALSKANKKSAFGTN